MSPVSIPEGIMERGGASSKLIFCFIIFIRDGNFERNWGGKRIFIARFSSSVLHSIRGDGENRCVRFDPSMGELYGWGRGEMMSSIPI